MKIGSLIENFFMTKAIILDSGPLGLIVHPRGSSESEKCVNWLLSMLKKGLRIFIPEIADYELRREMILNDNLNGIKKLDDLKRTIDYIQINTETMLYAAELWAQIRKKGKPTADKNSLDIDVILAAQARFVMSDIIKDEIIIATTNVGHLSLFVNAEKWENINL